LLSDGTSTYTYDAANRLTAVSGPSSATYAYNGLGDRYQQTVGSQTTTYVLDLNSGLTQVLSDGTNTYTYGLGRISQQGTSAEYFLGDALGSVRQLTNQAGAVTYAKSYDPYGVVTQASGASVSAYGFTGEQQSNDMVYLRARYYNVVDGRFVSRDTWAGDANRPLSLNRWNYTRANPINYVDPSGHITEKEADEADEILNLLQPYGVTIKIDWGMNYWNYWFNDPVDSNRSGIRTSCNWVTGVWSIDELRSVKYGVMALGRAMGGPQKFMTNLGGVSIEQKAIDYGGTGVAHHVTLDLTFTLWTVVHELSHAWDGNHNWGYSNALMTYTGGSINPQGSMRKMAAGLCDLGLLGNEDEPGHRGREPGCNKAGYFYGDMPSGSNWIFNQKEDFAESVTMYIGWSGTGYLYNMAHARIERYANLGNGDYDKVSGVRDNWADYAKYFYPEGGDYTKTKRWQFVDDLIQGKISYP
jgi:RHS repeat-associated protein